MYYLAQKSLVLFNLELIVLAGSGSTYNAMNVMIKTEYRSVSPFEGESRHIKP